MIKEQSLSKIVTVDPVTIVPQRQKLVELSESVLPEYPSPKLS
jgi:hypothetical protein